MYEGVKFLQLKQERKKKTKEKKMKNKINHTNTQFKSTVEKENVEFVDDSAP